MALRPRGVQHLGIDFDEEFTFVTHRPPDTYQRDDCLSTEPPLTVLHAYCASGNTALIFESSHWIIPSRVPRLSEE